MPGAYTAKPDAEEESQELPVGWNDDWPFPGPLPPGYEPNYLLKFVSPPTPTGVGIDEEITVRVKVYEIGAADSELGTIAPNENISWEAWLDGDDIATSSTGWTYISGVYYSSWTFTPPLTSGDVTDPPKVMTVYADGTMNNGSTSSSLAAEEEIEVVDELAIDVAGGLLTATFGSAIWAWYTKMTLDVYDGDLTQVSHNRWKYGATNAGGPTFELLGESWGSVPTDTVASINGAKGIGLVIPPGSIDPDYTYTIKLEALANDETSVSITTDLTGEISNQGGVVSTVTGGGDPPKIIDLGWIISHSGMAEFRLSPSYDSNGWEIVSYNGTFSDVDVDNN